SNAPDREEPARPARHRPRRPRARHADRGCRRASGRRGDRARVGRHPGPGRPAGRLDDAPAHPLLAPRPRGRPPRPARIRRCALMTLFERADTDKGVSLWTLVGLVLVPVLVAAGLVLATWKAGDRLDQVTAAVVNLDEGAEIDGQTVPLGRQLAAGIVDADEDQNVRWVLSDEEDRKSTRLNSS